MTKQAKTESVLTKDEGQEIPLHTQMAGMKTSQKIRFLTALGTNRSEIAKILNIRYQHVRNVQLMPTKRQ